MTTGWAGRPLWTQKERRYRHRHTRSRTTSGEGKQTCGEGKGIISDACSNFSQAATVTDTLENGDRLAPASSPSIVTGASGPDQNQVVVRSSEGTSPASERFSGDVTALARLDWTLLGRSLALDEPGTECDRRMVQCGRAVFKQCRKDNHQGPETEICEAASPVGRSVRRRIATTLATTSRSADRAHHGDPTVSKAQAGSTSMHRRIRLRDALCTAASAKSLRGRRCNAMFSS